MLGTPRASVDAAYPSNLMSNLSGNFSGQVRSPSNSMGGALCPPPTHPPTPRAHALCILARRFYPLATWEAAAAEAAHQACCHRHLLLCPVFLRHGSACVAAHCRRSAGSGAEAGRAGDAAARQGRHAAQPERAAGPHGARECAAPLLSDPNLCPLRCHPGPPHAPTHRSAHPPLGPPSSQAPTPSFSPLPPSSPHPPSSPSQFSSGQLSSVPEGFPIINAPPPSSWGAGRFSLDSAAERLSEDMSRMSFEGAARWAGSPPGRQLAAPARPSLLAPRVQARRCRTAAARQRVCWGQRLKCWLSTHSGLLHAASQPRLHLHWH